MPWNDLAARLQIKKARIVAMIADGGVVLENCDIEYVEGRLRGTSDWDNDKPTNELTFVTAWSVIGTLEPLASQQSEARVVIQGAGSGGRIEIRGDGWFGYDNDGNPEGRFNKPPTIIVDELAPFPARSGEDASGEDWAEQMRAVQPLLSTQYQHAMRGRPRTEDAES